MARRRGKDGEPSPPWTVRWHIAPDGTVFQERSRGEQAHQQLFSVYPTTRRVTLGDIEAVERRVEEIGREAARLTFPVMSLGILSALVMIAGFVVGFAGHEVGLVMIVLGLAGVSAAPYLLRFLVRRSGPDEDPWADAGFDKRGIGVTIASGQAREWLRDPRTVSGPATREGQL